MRCDYGSCNFTTGAAVTQRSKAKAEAVRLRLISFCIYFQGVVVSTYIHTVHTYIWMEEIKWNGNTPKFLTVPRPFSKL